MAKRDRDGYDDRDDRDDRDGRDDRGRRDTRDGRDEPRRGGERSGGSSFNYRGRSSESVARRARESGGTYDSYLKADAPMFKPQAGENCVRILPRAESDDFDKWGDLWGITATVHYNVGPDDGTYLCLDETEGGPGGCPVCAIRADADEETRDALSPKKRCLCWVIDRNNSKLGPQLWAMPWSLSQDVCVASQVKGSNEALLIDNPDEGYDVYFDKEGDKKRTRYKRVEVARTPSSLSSNPETQERWLAFINAHSLPDMLCFHDASRIEKVLSGRASSRDRGDARERDDVDDMGRASFRDSRSERRDRDDDDDRGSRRGRDDDGGDYHRDRGRAESRAAVDDDDRSSRRGRDRGDDRSEPEARAPRRGRDDDAPRSSPEPRSGRRVALEDDDVPFDRTRASGESADPSESAPAKRGEPRRRPVDDEAPSRERGGEGGDAERAPATKGTAAKENPTADSGASGDSSAVAAAKGRLARLGRKAG